MALMLAPFASAQVAPLKVEDLVAISDIVVTVRVTDLSTGFHGRQMTTTARMEVLDSIKGKSTGPLEMTYLGGTYGTVVSHVPQLPVFEKGDEAVLFLSKPADRLSAKAKSSLDATSPMVQSYQVVGGHLGRFALVDKEGVKNKARKGTDALPADLIVTRSGALSPSSDKSAAPGYASFRSEVAALVAAEAAKKASKGTPDKIAGVNGSFAIPAKSTSTDIRRFDPLPPLAYMSREEVDALNQKARAAAKAAQSNSKESAEK